MAIAKQVNLKKTKMSPATYIVKLISQPIITLQALYDKKIDGRGLGVFRIVFNIILFLDVFHLYYFRHLIYDEVPYLEPSNFDVTIPFMFWFASIILLIFGLFTRTAAIINYIFAVLFIGTMGTYEYHMYYIYMGICFLFIILPVSKCYSFDRLLIKLKYSNTRHLYKPDNKVSQLSYLMIVFVGIGLVYFDSIFYKSVSPMWLRGLGVWLPASLPAITHIDNTWLLNQEVIIKILGYLTLAFEATFIFLMWFKKLRPYLFIVGIGLHLGIFLEFPIPLFALGYCAIYLLLLPVSLFERKKVTSVKHTLEFYYDQECPLCVRTIIILKHLDVLQKLKFTPVQKALTENKFLEGIPINDLLANIYSSKNGKLYSGLDTYIQVTNSIFYLKPVSWVLRIPGIYHISGKVYNYIASNRNTERCTEDNCGYIPPVFPNKDSDFKILSSLTLHRLKGHIIAFILVVLFVLQTITAYNSDLGKFVRNKSGIIGSIPDRVFSIISSSSRSVTKVLFGIYSHGVFMDYHFTDYNHIVTLEYIDSNSGKHILLPLSDERGMPIGYNYAIVWAKWAFRMNAANINDNQLLDGLKDFTAFWAKKNDVRLNDATFAIKVKKVDVPESWEKDFLKNQIDNPWIYNGTVVCENEKFRVEGYTPVESL